MPVCAHCGTTAAEGALFCAKCGFTLPQTGLPGAGGSPLGSSVPPAGWTPSAAPPPPARTIPPPPPTAPSPPPPPPAAWGPPPGVPTAPPPNGKYCERCGTLIARAAVYCPVCQQPQGP